MFGQKKDLRGLLLNKWQSIVDEVITYFKNNPQIMAEY